MAELCVVVDALAEGGPLCDGSARVWGDKVVRDLLDVQLDTVDAPAGVGNMRCRLTDVHHAVGIHGKNGVAPLFPEGVDLIPWSIAEVLKDVFCW